MATLNQGRLKREKKKRKRWWIILTIIEIIISIWLVSEIDIVMMGMANGKFKIEPVPYMEALSNLVISKKLQTLFFCTQLAYVTLAISVGLRVRPVIDKVDTVFLTPDIEVPIPAGNGQHGAERFMTEEEKKDHFEVFEYDGRNPYPKLPGNGGVVLQMTKVGNKEQILYYGGEIHSIILGASGAGKTRRLLLETLWMQILAEQSVVVSDVKGEIYYYTKDYAEADDYTTLAFDLRNPKKSVHYNYLQPILDAFDSGDQAAGIDSVWDLVSVLVGEQKGEPLWYNGETATIAAAILIVAIEAPREYRNLTNVYYFLAYMCQSDAFGNMPLNLYMDTLPDEHPAKGVFAMATIAADKTRSSFFTSALGTLRLFTNPNVAEMTSYSDFKLENISSSKTILYMMIPDENKTLYPLVSILITQLYQAQVKQANKNGLRLPIDTDFDLDEVGNFPYIPVLGNMASAGRSRGIRINLVFQDYQQGETKYKDEFENIKTNCQLKLYLKSDSEKTLKSISEVLGNYTVELSSASTSSSDSKQQGMNISTSSSLGARKLLEPAELKRIKAPYAVGMLTGEYPAMCNLPDLSEYHLNKLYGLGDKKHNAEMIMQREAAREERDIPPIKLWGIWKQFQDQMQEEAGERVSFL